jgi:hypothetical protein
MGARNIDSILSASIMPDMAQELLRHMTSGRPMPKTITIHIDEQKTFRLIFGHEADVSETAETAISTKPFASTEAISVFDNKGAEASFEDTDTQDPTDQPDKGEKLV